MKKMRYAKGNTSTLKAMILGAVIIWVCFFALTLISALILYSGNDPTSKATLFSLISFVASGAIGSFINKRLFHSSSVNIPLSSALLCAVIYVFIASATSGKILIGSIISAACFLLISSLFSLPKRKTRSHRTRAHRS